MSSKTSLGEHLRELRTRLLVVSLSFLFWSGIGYLLREPILENVLRPLGQAVYYTSPQGGFEFLMRVIITIGFIGAVPVMVHQLMRFTEPALKGKLDPKLVRRLLIYSSLLAIAGVAFGYAVVLPTSLQFFAEFGGSQLKALISADQYLNFVLGILATFAIIFQLPLIVNIIDNIKPLQPKQLTKYRRHVIVGSLIIALALPFTYDPITQFVIAAPIMFLFELSVITIRLHRRTTRKQKKAQRVDHLVGLLHEAKAPVPKEIQEPVVAKTEVKEELPAEIVVEETPAPLPQKKSRVVVGPTRLNSRVQPRILDLRNA